MKRKIAVFMAVLLLISMMNTGIGALYAQEDLEKGKIKPDKKIELPFEFSCSINEAETIDTKFRLLNVDPTIKKVELFIHEGENKQFVVSKEFESGINEVMLESLQPGVDYKFNIKLEKTSGIVDSYVGELILDTKKLEKHKKYNEAKIRVVNVEKSIINPAITKNVVPGNEVNNNTADSIYTLSATRYESEPNDYYYNANITYDDDNMYGTMSSTVDNDWYRVSFPSNGKANFYLGSIPAGCDYDLFLYDSDGATLLTGSSAGGNADELISQYTVIANKIYYIKVKSYTGSSTSSYYQFRAKNYPTSTGGDVYEPNNTFGTARFIGNNVMISNANLDTAADRDYYMFTIGTTSNVSISLANIPYGCDYELKIYNSVYSLIGGSTLSGNAPEYVSMSLAPGTYYIEIYPYQGYSTSYYLLQLTSTSTSTPDYYEPNDAIGAAKGIGSNTIISDANIHMSTDVDYFRLNLASRTNMTIGLSNIPANCDYDLGLCDYSGNLIANSAYGGTTPENIPIVLEAGTYYIKVYSYSGSSSSFYRLQTTGTLESLPNLVISNIKYVDDLPTFITNGRRGSFAVEIKNTGSVSTPALNNFRIEMKDNGNLIGWTQSSFPQIPAGGTSNFILSKVSDPYIFTAGNHSLVTTIDATNAVNESDENNTNTDNILIINDDNETSNDTKSGAVNLTMNTRYYSKISSRTDIPNSTPDNTDWYKIVVPAGTSGYLNVYVGMPTSVAVNYDIELQDQNGNLLTFSENPAQNGYERVLYKLTSGGTFYLKVYSKQGYDNNNFYDITPIIETTTTYGGEHLGWDALPSKVSIPQNESKKVYLGQGMDHIWDSTSGTTYSQIMSGGMDIWNNANIRIPSSSVRVFDSVTTNPGGNFITAVTSTDQNTYYIAHYEQWGQLLTFYEPNMQNVSLPGLNKVQSIHAIIAHELGHALGLEDMYADGDYSIGGVVIDNRNKLMYGYASQQLTGNLDNNGNLRYLHDRDIVGVKNIQWGAGLAQMNNTRTAKASYIKVSDEELYNDSYMIVRGKVKSVRDSSLSHDSTYFSDVTLEVSKYYKDQSGKYENEITFLQDGNSQLQFEENMLFREGEECILFLKMSKTGSLIIMGGPQGRYDISDNMAGDFIVEKHIDKLIKEKYNNVEFINKKHKTTSEFDNDVELKMNQMKKNQ